MYSPPKYKTPVKNENKYTYTIPVNKFTANTDQTINITVTDKVGKTATKSFDVYYDNAAPIVGISSPTENSAQDQQTIPVTFTLAETSILCSIRVKHVQQILVGIVKTERT